jgi:quercetin dioxygenase-like cupin family protein
MSLLIKAADLPWGGPQKHQLMGNSAQVRLAMVYGEQSNLLVGYRPPGYHSAPHRHYSEQLNYCTEGEIWFYIDDKGYKMEEGDFLRVPSWAPHWVWNQSDTTNTLIEVHTPVIKVHERFPLARPLDGEGEDFTPQFGRSNVYLGPEVAETIEKLVHGPTGREQKAATVS